MTATVPIIRIWRKWVIWSVFIAFAAGAAIFFWQSPDIWLANQHTQAPPVFVALEPLTVNLQSRYGEGYLHTAITLEVGKKQQVRLVNDYLPEIRNQLLLLLSAQGAESLAAPSGRVALSQLIQQNLNQSLMQRTGEAPITSVLFTTFLVQ